MVGLQGNLSSALLCNELPNPFTPMAFLPPHLAFQAKFSEFVIACSLALLIWDQLHTLSDDYVLAFKKDFRWPTAVYFVSSVQVNSHAYFYMPFPDSQTNHCKLLGMALCICFVFLRASTAFLMYFRVCAVYAMNRSVVIFFGFTWLAAIIGAITPFHAMESTYIGPTKYCTSIVKDNYLILLSLTDLANDVLILVAIMYKLGVTTSEIPGVWKTTGRLHRFTRVFLQDSQMYYAVTVILNLSTIITFFAVDTPAQSPVRFTIIFPAAAIVSIMACRVFRNVKLGRYSRVLVMPTQIEAGNPTHHDCKPTINGENLYHMGDMDAPITDSNRSVMETPSTRLG
ncbi:hypothetical protein M413DRAFT_435158 [Hebeloma cylindrosporum]|uniref:G-protein coupled receptors family 1 profile domain-containing protein n=1 Tax=Hebeloma cylindrosporum TaxID=76867 RepID=A0A0C3CH92_HEBCY|nr:hypothetical protein M413DRAFT_435158 [Hebeloma cylindrosporum h7]